MKCSICRNLRCQKTDTDTDTGSLSRIGPDKRYTLRVNWPGFKGLTKIYTVENTCWNGWKQYFLDKMSNFGIFLENATSGVQNIVYI